MKVSIFNRSEGMTIPIDPKMGVVVVVVVVTRPKFKFKIGHVT